MIEAKKEYTTQLQQILSPRIYERFKFIFDGTIQVVQKELAMSQVQSGSVMKIFQKQLSSIKDWNESNIIEEYERIKSRSKCNYLDKLIKAVIIANMKILSTIQYGARKSKSKIQVHIPTPTHFIHRCYVECAKEIYKNPYIFDMSSSLSSKEKHQNLRDSLLIIDNGISSAIRQLLPIGDLLEQNFNSDAEDEDTDDESSVDRHRGHRQKGGSVTSSEEESDEEEMSSEDDETSTGGGSSEGEDDEDMSSEDGGSDEGGHESDMSSISSGTASEDDDDEENATLGGGQSQKSESSISKRSQALASRVESYLEDQTADDIQISIGGDKETQSILANVMEQRAENADPSGSTQGYFGGGVPQTPNPTPQSSPVYSPAPAPPQPPAQPQSNGGFLGALYTTFASSRNMKPNADDVSVPTVKSNPPPTSPIYGGTPQYQQQRPEEVKQIVFSGTTKLPPGFASMPAEPPKPVIATPASVPASAPAPAPVALAPAPVPAVNPNYGIYPPRVPPPPQSPVYQQPTKPVAPKPIAPTQSHMMRPQMGSKKLSLKEQKYGVKSSSSSAIRIDSDDDASFHF